MINPIVLCSKWYALPRAMKLPAIFVLVWHGLKHLAIPAAYVFGVFALPYNILNRFIHWPRDPFGKRYPVPEVAEWVCTNFSGMDHIAKNALYYLRLSYLGKNEEMNRDFRNALEEHCVTDEFSPIQILLFENEMLLK